VMGERWSRELSGLGSCMLGVEVEEVVEVVEVVEGADSREDSGRGGGVGGLPGRGGRRTLTRGHSDWPPRTSPRIV